MKNSSTEVFTTLQQQLKECPTDENVITAELLERSWNEIRSSGTGSADRPTPSIMAVMLLAQPEFRSLLSETEYNQLAAIVMEAVNRYQKIINPNNPVGRKLADAIKEAQTI